MQRQYGVEVPAVVRAAKRAAVERGFDLRPEGNSAGRAAAGPSACLDEVGALLRTLTASRSGGRIGEVGTGAGVGTAWLAAGLCGGAALVTVELDPGLAAAARELFRGRQDVEVLEGDWVEVLPQRGPFDLLFFDGGGREALLPENWPLLAGLLRPSGVMVLDDLTPEERWPDSWRGRPDPKRELAFRSGLFVATEVRSRADAAVLLLVRRDTAEGSSGEDLRDSRRVDPPKSRGSS